MPDLEQSDPKNLNSNSFETGTTSKHSGMLFVEDTLSISEESLSDKDIFDFLK